MNIKPYYLPDLGRSDLRRFPLIALRENSRIHLMLTRTLCIESFKRDAYYLMLIAQAEVHFVIDTTLLMPRSSKHDTNCALVSL